MGLGKTKLQSGLIYGVGGLGLVSIISMVSFNLFAPIRQEKVHNFNYQGKPAVVLRNTNGFYNRGGYHVLIDNRDILKRLSLVSDEGDTIIIKDIYSKELYINGKKIK